MEARKEEEALSSLGEEMSTYINSWCKGPRADTQHSVALQELTLLVPDLCPQEQEEPVPTGKKGLAHTLRAVDTRLAHWKCHCHSEAETDRNTPPHGGVPMAGRQSKSAFGESRFAHLTLSSGATCPGKAKSV